ncbi:amino acid adenylation domain-containing protein [Streptosporangiaceae bacterium NEAU-GS5]|nr:amino acid adenylation domain-containing protein [Streptosporangiaceae bacterium NEAU-GS5]
MLNRKDHHALRVRLPGADAELIAKRLSELAPHTPLWVEPAGPSTDPLSARRRARETTRPVPPAAGVRAVLIEYSDGPADLVLVAHRAAVGRSALRRLAAALLGETEAEPIVPAVPSVSVVPAADTGSDVRLPVVAPGWGMGDPRAGDEVREHRLALPAGTAADPASWLAAIAVVLARYSPEESQESVTVGLFDAERPGPLRAATANVAAGTLGDLATRIAQDLVMAPASAPAPSVGLVVDVSEEDSEDLGADVESTPFLEPPFPLTIVLSRMAGGVSLRAVHRLADVGPQMAAQFLRHLAHAHRYVAVTPDLPAVRAGLYDAAELRRIRELGLPPRALDTRPRRIEKVFAERAAETPDAVALSDDDLQVTYRELDEWSDQLAHGLRGAGVRDGDFVGVCLDRSAELIAILLAILKAGAVYVPMDPAYPVDRLAYTTEDSGIGVLVTRLAEFPAPDGVQAVTPDRISELGAPHERTGPPASAARPADPAYVIYTSGSTGRPKGVLVAHANVISLLDATRDGFGLGSADVWTFFHSIAFDFSVWEVWGSLLTGGQLVVVPYWVSRSPEQFRALLRDRKVTVLNQTPSAFLQLVAADRGCHDQLAVRLVIFGGEALETPALLPWLDRYPESRCRLVNMYGITETTVHVTEQTLDRGMALCGSRSVGRPLPGWNVYVMDAAGRPAPPGVIGEIYVGGAGVALGYLGKPGLTAQRFPADPVTGERLYRSGDRGRLRPDGMLEHLGRMDNQVKLRGFRIELDEIRLVLVESPGVTAAAVMLRQEDPDDPATARLDAYVVLSDGASTADLRQHLARVLPDYMLPSTVTALPVIPLTANGKADLKALPAPVADPPTPAETVESTGDEIADGLLEVWQEIFGFPVRVTDDFFALGGNSLFAVRMAAAMRERGMPALHPRTLYLNPTVGQLTIALR